MRFAAVLTTLVLVAGFAVAEDKVTFKDGKVTTGEILSVTTSDIQILTTDGEKMRVLRAVIAKVERDGVLLDLDSDDAARSSRPARPPRPLPWARTFEATPALLAWLDVCAAQLATDDEGVRAGATAALLSAGKTAIPVLKQAAERDDQIAPTAMRVMALIERQEQRRVPRPQESKRP